MRVHTLSQSYACAYTLSPSHTHARTHSLPVIRMRVHTLSKAHSLSLTRTHTLSKAHTHTYTHTHTISLHARTHTYTHPLSHSHTRAYTLSFHHSLTHAYTHTHSNTKKCEWTHTHGSASRTEAHLARKRIGSASPLPPPTHTKKRPCSGKETSMGGAHCLGCALSRVRIV